MSPTRRKAPVALRVAAERVQATKEDLLNQLAYLERKAEEEGDRDLQAAIGTLYSGVLRLRIGSLLKEKGLVK